MDVSEKVLKLLLVGDAGVGKSSWVSCLLDGFHQSEYTPTDGYNCERIHFSTNSYNIGCAKFDFWDISGAQSTSQDRAKWMEDGDAAIIMVDLADRASIENATCWYKEIIPSQQDSQNSASIPVSIFSWKAYEKTDKRAISPTEISWSDGLYDIPFFYTTHLDLNEKANRIIADGIDRRPLGWILEQLTDEVNVEFPIVYSPDQSLHSCHDPDWLKHVAPEAYWMELPSDDDGDL